VYTSLDRLELKGDFSNDGQFIEANELVDVGALRSNN